MHFITTILQKLLSNLSLEPRVKKIYDYIQKEIHVNCEYMCFLYRVEKGKVTKIEDTWLWCNLKEAFSCWTSNGSK